MLQRGQSGVVWLEASTLFRYDVRNGDLCVLSCARKRFKFCLMCAGVTFLCV